MLHADKGMTRFWLFQLTGRKRVRLLPPSENWRGHASDGIVLRPTLFTIDLMNPDFERFPDLDGMLV
jgi:hypothetical protein